MLELPEIVITLTRSLTSTLQPWKIVSAFQCFTQILAIEYKYSVQHLQRLKIYDTFIKISGALVALQYILALRSDTVNRLSD